MRLGARLAAAMEVITAIDREHRPASVALADWGRLHRFAGSGDRSAIGTIVYDVLRRRRSLAAQMGSDKPRALVLAAAVRACGLSPGEIEAATASGEAHAPAPVTVDERQRLEGGLPSDTPLDVCADLPKWLMPSLNRAFGERLVAEGEAMAQRAPIDLRVNTLKADREQVLRALVRFGAEPTPLAPYGIRIPAPIGSARAPNVEAETAHGKGWFEVQDEGSQVAAALAGAGSRQQVLDLCAGAGGKTLALGALMRNMGRIVAFDVALKRLAQLKLRVTRSGLSNVYPTLIMDESDNKVKRLAGKIDRVLVDAPCSGLGTLRRSPDMRWRQTNEGIHALNSRQLAILSSAASLLKVGGRLVYATCSVLEEENEAIVDQFLALHADFILVPMSVILKEQKIALTMHQYLKLLPHIHQTDGFFAAVFERVGI